MNTQENRLDFSVYANKNVVFLFGPTAVGKTALLQSFFSEGYEVVNADSVQVYKDLNIGSAKADPGMVPRHHLVDILEPWESFNVATFVRLADEACSDIISRGKTPVLSGGTAYYFKHFLYGLSEAPEASPEVRRDVASFMESAGKDGAFDYLRSVDPESARKIHPNDVYRVSRAIEVFRQTGRPLSSFKVPSVPRGGMRPVIIGLYREKAELDERIRLRVDMMFKEGLVEEVRSLISMGASSAWQSMQAIGYREFISAIERDNDESGKAEDGARECLNGSSPRVCSNCDAGKTENAADGIRRRLSRFELLDFGEIREEIIMNSIHYAKRQNTFFNSFHDVKRIHAEDTETLKKILNAALEE